MIESVKQETEPVTNFWSFKNCLLLFLALASVIAIIVAISFYKKYNATKQTAITNTNVINTATELVKKFTDTLGKKHTQFQAQSAITEKERDTDKLPGWADTAGRSLDLGADYKEKLMEATQLNVILKDSLLKAKVRIDAQKRETYYYKNKFLEISFTKGLEADTADHGSFAYKYNAKINVTQFYKKSWLLGSKKSIIDVSADDPNMLVNSVQHYQVVQNQPLLGLRIQAIGAYNFTNRVFQPGLGAEFDIGNTSLYGAGILNTSPLPTQKRITFSLTARHNLISF